MINDKRTEQTGWKELFWSYACVMSKNALWH